MSDAANKAESNGYLSPFCDGYERTAIIPAHPGLWSDVTIIYRPVCQDELLALGQEIDSNANAKSPSRSFYARFMATKILGWDLKDRDGKKVEINADSIGKLHHRFYRALREQVFEEADYVADIKN